MGRFETNFPLFSSKWDKRKCESKKNKNIPLSPSSLGMFVLMKFQAWFPIRRCQLFVKTPNPAWSLALRSIFYLYRAFFKSLLLRQKRDWEASRKRQHNVFRAYISRKCVHILRQISYRRDRRF
jgi:hypothetical protein